MEYRSIYVNVRVHQVIILPISNREQDVLQVSNNPLAVHDAVQARPKQTIIFSPLVMHPPEVEAVGRGQRGELGRHEWRIRSC